MGRRALPAEIKREIWRRWKAGESLNEIARGIGKNVGSVSCAVGRTGGYPPPPRRRSKSVLSLAEREEISRGLVAGLSMRGIAEQLGRAPSTVSREIKRNGGGHRYRASTVERRFWQQTLRLHLPARGKHGSPSLRSIVDVDTT